MESLGAKNKKAVACDNCQDDSYEENLQQYLEFLQTGQSTRLMGMFKNDSAGLYKSQRIKLEEASKLFHIGLCTNGTQHLWKDQSKVLMIKETFNFVSELHGPDHLQGQAMMEKAWQYKVHLPQIYGFIGEFPLFCAHCLSKKKAFRVRGRPVSPLWAILKSKWNLGVQNWEGQETIEQLLKQFNFTECVDNSCTRDQYDRENEICIFIKKFNRFPVLPKGEGSAPNLIRLKRKSTYMTVLPCRFGTDHLYMKDRNLRIPMVKEAKEIARILHGERAHRCKKKMKEIIFSEGGKIEPYGLYKAINEVVGQCAVCNPKTAEIKEDCMKDGDQVVEIDGRERVPFERMGIQMKQEYFRQLMENPESREKVLKVRQMANNLKIWQDPSTHFQTFTKEIGLFPLAIELALDDNHWTRCNADTLELLLSQHPELIYRAIHEKGKTKVVFLCTESMRYSYFRYGETLCIDYVSGVTRKREASGRNFVVGLLTGVDHAGGVVLFGVTMISKELSTYYLKSLELFYDVMGCYGMPKLVCIPDLKPLIISLEVLQKQKGVKFQYAISWFYILQFLKKNLAQQPDKTQILSLFAQAISEPIPALHRSTLQRILSQIVNTGLYRQVERLGQAFCLSRIGKNFVGYGLSTARTEELFRLVEKEFRYGIKLGTFFGSVVRVQRALWESRGREGSARMVEGWDKGTLLRELIKRQKEAKLQPVEVSDYLLEQLLSLSQTLHPKIFSLLLQTATKSLPNSLHLSQPQNPTVQTLTEAKPHPRCVYQCRYSIADCCWVCNCGLTYLTALPCCHLIRVVGLYRGSLEYYVGTRWRMSQAGDCFEWEEKEEKIGGRVEQERDQDGVKLQMQSGDQSQFASSSMVPQPSSLQSSNPDPLSTPNKLNSPIQIQINSLSPQQQAYNCHTAQWDKFQ